MTFAWAAPSVDFHALAPEIVVLVTLVVLLLVDAFTGGCWRSLYEMALAEGYRFLSFGDAMLIL